jgi:hypothetical protein
MCLGCKAERLGLRAIWDAGAPPIVIGFTSGSYMLDSAAISALAFS